MGNNKKPFFRVVVADERCPQSGRYLENLGWYDPKMKGHNYDLKLDRYDFWKARGAVVTDTAASLFRKAKLKAARDGSAPAAATAAAS